MPMPSTDLFALSIIETLLAFLWLTAVGMDVIIRVRERSADMVASVTRGEKSMSSLHVMYGIATVVYSLAVDVATGVDGHKVLIIAANYACLTYMFYFSSWFRNQVFFPLLARAQQD